MATKNAQVKVPTMYPKWQNTMESQEGQLASSFISLLLPFHSSHVSYAPVGQLHRCSSTLSQPFIICVGACRGIFPVAGCWLRSVRNR